MIIHADFTEISRLFSKEENPLVPPSVKLTGGYYPCSSWKELQNFLQSTSQVLKDGLSKGLKKCAILLFHLTDLEQVLQSTQGEQITRWLQGSPEGEKRYLLVYSMRHNNWARCMNPPRSVADDFSPEWWQKRWTLFPWTELTGPARQLSWLYLSCEFGLELSTYCRPADQWLEEAGEIILGFPSKGSNIPLTADGLREFLSFFIGHILLEECLDKSRARNRSAEERRACLFEVMDQLWLLEGMIQVKSDADGQFSTYIQKIRETLKLLEKFYSSLNSLNELDQKNRESWEPLIQRLEELFTS